MMLEEVIKVEKLSHMMLEEVIKVEKLSHMMLEVMQPKVKNGPNFQQVIKPYQISPYANSPRLSRSLLATALIS